MDVRPEIECLFTSKKFVRPKPHRFTFSSFEVADTNEVECLTMTEPTLVDLTSEGTFEERMEELDPSEIEYVDLTDDKETEDGDGSEGPVVLLAPEGYTFGDIEILYEFVDVEDPNSIVRFAFRPETVRDLTDKVVETLYSENAEFMSLVIEPSVPSPVVPKELVENEENEENLVKTSEVILPPEEMGLIIEPIPAPVVPTELVENEENLAKTSEAIPPKEMDLDDLVFKRPAPPPVVPTELVVNEENLVKTPEAIPPPKEMGLVIERPVPPPVVPKPLVENENSLVKTPVAPSIPEESMSVDKAPERLAKMSKGEVKAVVNRKKREEKRMRVREELTQLKEFVKSQWRQNEIIGEQIVVKQKEIQEGEKNSELALVKVSEKFNAIVNTFPQPVYPYKQHPEIVKLMKFCNSVLDS